MTRSTGEPTPERRPVSGGTGNTGNPCEHPGCRSRNAKARVDWSREGLDDRAADQSLRTLCDEHRDKQPKRSTKSSGRSTKASKLVPKPRKAPDGSSSGAKHQGQRTAKGSAGVSQKLLTEVVRLQRAWERAAAVLSSDPEQTKRVCAVALRDEKGLRTEAGRAASGPSGKSEGKKLLRLLDELDALQRKAEAAQHAVVERERLRERARDFRAKKAAGTASDQIWINGRRPIGISELLEVRALVVRHLNRGRDREAARLCSTLLTTGETAMSAAGREGDRMRSFLRACRTEACDNLRAKGVIPALTERQWLVQQLGAFTKKGARYVKAQQMIESDSRRAVQLCDAALKELKRMPSSRGKKQARALWVELRDQAVSHRKRERSDTSPSSGKEAPETE